MRPPFWASRQQRGFTIKDDNVVDCFALLKYDIITEYEIKCIRHKNLLKDVPFCVCLIKF